MIKIVYSSYYEALTQNMLKIIEHTLDTQNIDHSQSEVKGVWEIPYKIKSFTKDFNYFIAVGIVVKGETDHYNYLSSAVSNALMNITTNDDVYISNAILNVHNIEQAKERSNTKGEEAALATINIINND
tara:strand:+ start:70 stop:456 length:387 start_codon:yes stop_codon:yes gene_type:complete